MTAGATLGWACALVAFGALAWGALVDARHRRIPNAAVGAVGLSALAQMALVTLRVPGASLGAYAYAYACDVTPNSVGLAIPGSAQTASAFLDVTAPGLSVPSRLAWGIGTLIVLACVEALWRCLRRSHGMGAGDIKLIGALGLWLGPLLVATLMLACLVGALVAVARRRRTFAFGPYLAFVGGVALLVLLLV